jgi:hypothetical protein
MVIPGTSTGALNDFDLAGGAAVSGDGEDLDHTGTRPYMVLDLLKAIMEKMPVAVLLACTVTTPSLLPGCWFGYVVITRMARRNLFFNQRWRIGTTQKSGQLSAQNSLFLKRR